MTLGDLLPAKTHKDQLVALLGELRKYGTKGQREQADCMAAGKRCRKEQVRELVLGLAERGRKKRHAHLSAMGGLPACWVEADHQPDLLERLLTPLATNGDATCKACREIAGLDDPDLEAQAQEDAEVAAFEQSKSSGRQPVAQGAKRPARKRKAKTGGATKAKVQYDRLDDGHGTALTNGDELRITFSYKGEAHVAVLHSDKSVVMGSETYPSPSAAGKALCQSKGCNGWVRWKYEASDGQTYLIDRLRGRDVAPVRKRGRPAKPETQAKKAAVVERRVARLEAKHDKAMSEAADAKRALTWARGRLGDDGDVRFGEDGDQGLFEEARLDDFGTRDDEARGLNEPV